MERGMEGGRFRRCLEGECVLFWESGTPIHGKLIGFIFNSGSCKILVEAFISPNKYVTGTRFYVTSLTSSDNHYNAIQFRF